MVHGHSACISCCESVRNEPPHVCDRTCGLRVVLVLACLVLWIGQKELRLGRAVGIEQRIRYSFVSTHYKRKLRLIELTYCNCERSSVLRIAFQRSVHADQRTELSVHGVAEAQYSA